MVDITPPLGYRMAGYFAERLNTGTHDPLFAKALVFRQGDRQAALVFCDLVGVPRAVASRARERASAATGIPVANIAVAATHSHTGPLYFGGMHTHLHGKAIAAEGRDAREELDYPAQLAERVAQAVDTAWKALAPVKLEAGTARETRLAFNRRFHMKDGSVRFNPGALNPDIVRPAGPVDPEVGILLVEPAREGPPIAGLTVFALHLDTTGGTEYSADYPVLPRDRAEAGAGPAVHLALRRRDLRRYQSHRREQARASPARGPGQGAGRDGAGRAGAAGCRSPFRRSTSSARWSPATCRSQTPAEIADARAKADLITTSKLPFLERVKIAKILDLLERYPEPSCSMEVQAFKLGPELAVVTLPGEVFVELGLAIKSRSPFETTLVVELANDVPNYIPTAKAFREGSYEVVNSRLAPGSGEQLVAAAVRLLKELDRPAR